jgi:hypothetical protein
MTRYATLAVALATVAVGAAACVPPGRYPGYYGQPYHGSTVFVPGRAGHHPWWVDNRPGGEGGEHGGDGGWGGSGGEGGEGGNDHHDGPPPWWVGNGGNGGNGGEGGGNGHHDGPPPWWQRPGNGGEGGWQGNGGESGGNGRDGPRPRVTHDGTPGRGGDGDGACGPVYWPGCDRG